MKEDFVVINDTIVNVKNINYIKFLCDENEFGNFFDAMEDDYDDGDYGDNMLNHMEIGFNGNEVSIILDNDPKKAKDEFNQYVSVIMNKLGENNLILD